MECNIFNGEEEFMWEMMTPYCIFIDSNFRTLQMGSKITGICPSFRVGDILSGILKIDTSTEKNETPVLRQWNWTELVRLKSGTVDLIIDDDGAHTGLLMGDCHFAVIRSRPRGDSSDAKNSSTTIGTASRAVIFIPQLSSVVEDSRRVLSQRAGSDDEHHTAAADTDVATTTAALVSSRVEEEEHAAVHQQKKHPCKGCADRDARIYQLEKELMAAKASLDMKSRFVRYVSHEIRTPLNTVSMGLSLLMQQKEEEAEDSGGGDGRSGASTSRGAATPRSITAANSFLRVEDVMSVSTPGRKMLQELETALSKYDNESSFSSSMVDQQYGSTRGAGGAGGVGGSLSLRVPLDDNFKSEVKLSSGNLLSLGLRTPFITSTSLSHTSSDRNISMAADLKESCDIAIEILNDLLLYEKIEGNIVTIEAQREPALSTIAHAVRTFDIQAKQHLVDLQFTYDTNSFFWDEIERPRYFIDVDRPKISQVIRNLTSNAIKFSSTGGTISIHVDIVRPPSSAVAAAAVLGGVDEEDDDGILSLEGYHLRVSVTDSGAGISPDNQKKLFGSIVQFDANKLQNGGGSGLGLYISKGIMDLHGGSIGVHSEGEGKGTTFHIELPVAYESDEQDSSADYYIAQLEDSCCNAPPPRIHTDKSNSSLRKILRSGKGTKIASSPLPTTFCPGTTTPSSVVAVSLNALNRSVNSVNSSPAAGSADRKRHQGLGDSSGGISHHPSHLEPVVKATTPTVPNSAVVDVTAGRANKGTAQIKIATTAAATTSKAVGGGPRKSSLTFPNSLRMIPERDDEKELSSSSPPISPPQTSSSSPFYSSSKKQHHQTSDNAATPSIRFNSITTSSATGASSPLPATATPKRKILVVDDSRINRRMTVRMLTTSAGGSYDKDTIDEAEDGLQALNKVVASFNDTKKQASSSSRSRDLVGFAYAAILMDYVMPHMDGPEATRRIREAGFKGLIIGITGNVGDEEVGHFKSSGADVVMGKPLDIKYLVRLLDHSTCGSAASVPLGEEGEKDENLVTVATTTISKMEAAAAVGAVGRDAAAVTGTLGTTIWRYQAEYETTTESVSGKKKNEGNEDKEGPATTSTSMITTRAGAVLHHPQQGGSGSVTTSTPTCYCHLGAGGALPPPRLLLDNSSTSLAASIVRAAADNSSGYHTNNCSEIDQLSEEREQNGGFFSEVQTPATDASITPAGTIMGIATVLEAKPEVERPFPTDESLYDYLGLVPGFGSLPPSASFFVPRSRKGSALATTTAATSATTAASGTATPPTGGGGGGGEEENDPMNRFIVEQQLLRASFLLSRVTEGGEDEDKSLCPERVASNNDITADAPFAQQRMPPTRRNENKNNEEEDSGLPPPSQLRSSNSIGGPPLLFLTSVQPAQRKWRRARNATNQSSAASYDEDGKEAGGDECCSIGSVTTGGSGSVVLNDDITCTPPTAHASASFRLPPHQQRGGDISASSSASPQRSRALVASTKRSLQQPVAGGSRHRWSSSATGRGSAATVVDDFRGGATGTGGELHVGGGELLGVAMIATPAPLPHRPRELSSVSGVPIVGDAAVVEGGGSGEVAVGKSSLLVRLSHFLLGTNNSKSTTTMLIHNKNASSTPPPPPPAAVAAAHVLRPATPNPGGTREAPSQATTPTTATTGGAGRGFSRGFVGSFIRHCRSVVAPAQEAANDKHPALGPRSLNDHVYDSVEKNRHRHLSHFLFSTSSCVDLGTPPLMNSPLPEFNGNRGSAGVAGRGAGSRRPSTSPASPAAQLVRPHHGGGAVALVVHC